MKRKLSYKALLLMEGQEVVVHDLEYDAYDQVCTVKIQWTTNSNPLLKKNKYKPQIEKVWLENEEFLFEFDWDGSCKNGEFEVYTLGG